VVLLTLRLPQTRAERPDRGGVDWTPPPLFPNALIPMYPQACCVARAECGEAIETKRLIVGAVSLGVGEEPAPP